MILNSTDLKDMGKISGEAALKYVEANSLESTVLRWKLHMMEIPEGHTQGAFTAAQTTALMYIWNAMSGYDLGKLCREWIAYGCLTSPGAILRELTSETGEPPKPSFSGSAVGEV